MLRDEMWDEAVRAVRGDVHGLVSVRDDLVRRWSEPHRGYHDVRHLDEVGSALGALRESALDSDTDWASVVLAAWFHDAVYDIDIQDIDVRDINIQANNIRDVASGADNERRSAELARWALTSHGADPDSVDAVVALVEASEAHVVRETRGPQAAFHDADLWVLGAPEGRFDEYCEAVRREYAVVPDHTYAEGRTAILAPFLAREWVYRTDHARRHWEPAARANLNRELLRLASPG